MANRLLLGKHPNFADLRLRISKAGFNVLSTGLTREQIHFDSTTFDSTIAIHSQGTFNIPDSVGGPGTNLPNVVTWADLGYIPMFFFYTEASGVFRSPELYMYFRVKRTGLDFVAGELMAPGNNKGFDCYYTALTAPEGGVLG